MGLWRCGHRYLARRLADCHDWLELDGSCAARKILDGYGNAGESDIKLPGWPYKGMTVRTYDPQTALWSIFWLDSRTRNAVRVRFIWSGITTRAARWEQAFSIDGGGRWETSWIMDFSRM